MAHEAADRYAATLWRLRRVPAIEAAFAEAARERAYVEECQRLESAHDTALEKEMRAAVEEIYDTLEEMIEASHNGEYQTRCAEFLSTKTPFQVPEKVTLPAAETFLMLIEAAELFDVLGKLSRYETALMNVAARQRIELEAYRAADEDPKLIDV